MKCAAIQPVFQPISSRNDLILKASAAERSLVLLIMKQQHLFITPLRAGSRLSIPSLTVPLLFGWQWVTPGLQRYIEVVRASVKHGDQLREKTSGQHISTNLFMNVPFVVDMMENVCCRRNISAQPRCPTQPRLFPYHCFNSAGGKGIRYNTGLWHLVSAIFQGRRRDLWNRSHAWTWFLLKPPVKATWP